VRRLGDEMMALMPRRKAGLLEAWSAPVGRRPSEETRTLCRSADESKAIGPSWVMDSRDHCRAEE
jgi:hypothetical protein